MMMPCRLSKFLRREKPKERKEAQLILIWKPSKLEKMLPVSTDMLPTWMWKMMIRIHLDRRGERIPDLVVNVRR